MSHGETDTSEDQHSSLDDRFVAAAAPRVARAVDTTAERLRRVRRAVQDVDLRDPRALDERYATSGPLALFREIPQLMAVVIGIVFVIGALAAAHDLRERRAHNDAQSSVTATDGSSAPAGSPSAVVVLGPTVGKPAQEYLALAARSLDDAATASPDEKRLALVSLTSYARPEAAAQAVAGLAVQRAWVRDGAAGRLAPPMPVEVGGDPLAGLRAFYARTAQGQRDAAMQYQQLADTTSNDPQYKSFYQQFATLSRKQAQAFGHDCACVYSFAVTATPSQLQQIRSRPGVRAVEVAGRGARLSGVDITTLLPEVRGVVPNPAAVVDPPS